MSNLLIKSRQSSDIIRENSVGYYRFGLNLSTEFGETISEVLKAAGQEVFLTKFKRGVIVPIASFNAPPRMEDTLARWTQRICSSLEKTEITFNNFSGLPPHTIYLRIQDVNPLKQLVGELRKLDFYLTGNGHQPLHGVQRFMLPIIENIDESKYENLVYRFGRIEFHKKVAVESLLLQKFEGNGWKDAQNFRLSSSLLQ
jgi:hypothetical protein